MTLNGCAWTATVYARAGKRLLGGQQHTECWPMETREMAEKSADQIIEANGDNADPDTVIIRQVRHGNPIMESEIA